MLIGFEWQAEAPLSNLAKVGGGHAPVAAEDLIPSPVMEEVEKDLGELPFLAEDLREEPSEINLKADQDDREPLMRGISRLLLGGGAGSAGGVDPVPPGGQLVDSSAEEDLSVAVAAVVEARSLMVTGTEPKTHRKPRHNSRDLKASGLVVRVVAKSFFRTLEKVALPWAVAVAVGTVATHDAACDAVEPEPPAPPPPPPLPEPEEVLGAWDSQSSNRCWVLRRFRPSPAAPFPSPAPLQQMQKQQVRQILESVSTPARGKSLGGRPEVAASPLNSAKYWSQKPVADGRMADWHLWKIIAQGHGLMISRQEDLDDDDGQDSAGWYHLASREFQQLPQPVWLRCNFQSIEFNDSIASRCSAVKNGPQKPPSEYLDAEAKATTPPPKQTTAVRRESSREPRVEAGHGAVSSADLAYSRPKSSLIVDKPRFRYGNGLKKLKIHVGHQEMGYEDTQEIRDARAPEAGEAGRTKPGGTNTGELRGH
eukprot:Skav217802  [mRNA]  locus=scaffold1782:480355:490218:- [translate_table: standard]